MATLDNPERIHIGRALTAHAANLGIGPAALEEAAGHSAQAEMRWIAAAAEPTVLRIRQYHFILIEAYEAARTRTEVPVPFREQWFTTDLDNVLHTGVLATGRRTAWWWGASRTPEGTGAYCYVCSALIHAYDLTRGATHPVRLAVMNHRAKHVAELIGATETKHGRKRT